MCCVLSCSFIMAEHTVEVERPALLEMETPSVKSGRWVIGGSHVPREEIVFFCQITVISIVVLVSLVNLCLSNGPESYWSAMVGTGLAALLPSPKIKRKK